MSNNIYDILGKLDRVTPSPEPVSETIYESVDPQGDIDASVTVLTEKYQSFKEATRKKAKKRIQRDFCHDMILD